MRFNINNIVKVRLTEWGRTIHRDAYYCLMGSHRDYVAPVEDEEGWSEWILWELMATFGKRIYQGGPVCFGTEIEIPT